jgi:hypothetical protein
MNLVPIQITIQAANASDLRALVADLAGTIATMAPANIPAETTVSTVDNTAANTPTVFDKYFDNQVALATEKQVAAATAEDVAEAIPTDVELRALAADKAKSAGRPAVKALLDKYGAASVTAVPQGSRIAFKADLEAL